VTGASTRCTFDSSIRISRAFAQSAFTSLSLIYSQLLPTAPIQEARRHLRKPADRATRKPLLAHNATKMTACGSRRMARVVFCSAQCRHSPACPIPLRRRGGSHELAERTEIECACTPIFVAYRLSCSICLSRSDIAIALVYDAVFARFFWTRGTDRMFLRGKCSTMQLRLELVLHDTMATDNRPPRQ
jgi:hypothetical protein